METLVEVSVFWMYEYPLVAVYGAVLLVLIYSFYKE